MRILEVHRMPSHHVLPLARCLAKLVGEDNFRYGALPDLFVSDRQRLGWNCNEREPWILHVGESEEDRREFERWWDDADIVLCAARRFDRMRDRIEDGRLTFYMSERWWKPPIGMARLLHPKFALMTARFLQLASSQFFHYLPIGSYAASDIKRIARFTGRMWKWGWFMTTPEPLPSCDRKEQRFQVLWAGRMDRLKRVDTLIKAFRLLLTERRDAMLTIVGFGQEQKRLERLASAHLPQQSYRFLPPMPQPDVLQLMLHHHVYVFPSKGSEGWGAVVIEAMGQGCAVLASEESGAAKAIIRHGKDGLLFASGDWKRLGELLCDVGGDEALRIRLAQEGQRTIAKYWSPAVAAERLLSVSNSLIARRPVCMFDDGPMARAWR